MLAAAASTNTDFCLHPTFIAAVSQYYNVAIGLAIILSVVMVIVGGYQMVLSTGNPTFIEKGKKRIQNALLGLGLAVASGVFLNFLNPRIFTSSQPGSCPKAAAQLAITVHELIQFDRAA